MDKQVQETAYNRVIESQLTAFNFVPNEKEKNSKSQYYDNDTDEESDEEEFDVMARRVEGTRKSSRAKTAAVRFGFQLSTDKIQLSSDDDEE